MAPGAGGLKPAKTANLEADARTMGVALERHKLLVLFVLTLIYALGAVQHARGKPLWYDEIITVIAASAPDVGSTWTAAMQVDANPPLPHLLTHFSMQWFGKNDVGVRVPAMVGFWIFCLCLFHFTRRRLGIFYGLAAMLLPVATDAYRYSVEARAYGLELGFCGLALVAWQAAAEGSRRVANLLLLAVSLAAAILCQYYAVLIFLPIAAGEALRAVRARKIDWAVWVAIAAGGAPVVWRAATIAGVVKGFAHTWATPYPEQILEFWQHGLAPAAPYLVLWMALLVLTHRQQDSSAENPAAVPEHEAAAGVAFLALPLIAVAGALLVTHMFTERYAIPALAGFALLLPLLAARFTGGRWFPGFVMFGVMVISLGVNSVTFTQPRNPYAGEPALSAALEQGPVVIPDGQLFLQMWYYAPERLKSRVVFLSDVDLAVKHMGFDTIDGGIPVLRPWAAVNVIENKSFHPEGGVFLAYENTLRPGWVLPDAAQRGDAVEVVRASPARLLLRIRRRPVS